MLRDGYSGFSFFQALAPFITTDPPAHAGLTVDRRGYDTVTFIVNVGQTGSAGSFAVDDFFQLKLEHASNSALGVDGVWSEVYPSQMLHSVIGMDGAYSALDSGIFQSIDSADEGSAAYAVGYKGPKRYVRVYISGELTPSVAVMGALAVLGKVHNWPVNDPVGE